MTKENALKLIQSGRAYEILRKEYEGRTCGPDYADNFMIVLGRFEGPCSETEFHKDDMWTAIAIRNDRETLKVEYHGFMVSHGGSMVIDHLVHDGGNAHQVSSGPLQGIWVWDMD